MWHSTILSVLIFTVLLSAKAQQNLKTDDDPYGCVCIPEHQCPQDYAINSHTLACETPGHMCCVLSNDTSLESPGWKSDLTHKGCGRHRENIFNLELDGGLASLGEYPWMILILNRIKHELRRSDTFTQRCGGSLIHPMAVLSAAHCVTNVTVDKLGIRAGEWNMMSREEPLPHQNFRVQEIITHEDYSKSCLCNDIAILILSSPVKLAEHINVVCLPDPTTSTRPSCVATGWGHDPWNLQPWDQRILKEIELPPFDSKACENAYRRKVPNFTLHTSVICAGGAAGRDTCLGDSGGPLVCRLTNDRTRYDRRKNGTEKPRYYCVQI